MVRVGPVGLWGGAATEGAGRWPTLIGLIALSSCCRSPAAAGLWVHCLLDLSHATPHTRRMRSYTARLAHPGEIVPTPQPVRACRRGVFPTSALLRRAELSGTTEGPACATRPAPPRPLQGPAAGVRAVGAEGPCSVEVVAQHL